MSTYLWVGKMMESILVCIVGFLQLIHHKEAMAKISPDFPTGRVNGENPLKVLCGLHVDGVGVMLFYRHLLVRPYCR